MPKTAKSAEPPITRDLTPDRTDCPHCGRPMTADYANRRTVHTLDRHAKKELKKKVRTVRGVERRMEGRDDPRRW